MSERSVDEIIEAYRNGEPEAQEELLQRVERRLLGYVRRSMGAGLRSLEESIDLTQSILLGFHTSVVSGKAKFDSEAAMHGYLKRMVRNKLANRHDWRTAAKRGSGMAPDSLAREDSNGAPREPAAVQPSPSDVASSEETKAKIEAELTEEEQLVLDGYLLGRSNREIADDIGKSPDAVRMIWHRARERLRVQRILDRQ